MARRQPRSNESWLPPKSFLPVARTGVSCPTERSAFTATGMLWENSMAAVTGQHIDYLSVSDFSCLVIHSACDRKPTPGFKPLTPPSTPVSPCGPTSTAGAHPLSEQTPPPHPHVANPNLGPRPVHIQQPITASACPPNQQALPVHSHSPPFAVPCAPISQDANNFTPEHRWALREFLLHSFKLCSFLLEMVSFRIMFVKRGLITCPFVSLGSRGRCQSHVYLSPPQRVAPSSCPSLPAATTVCNVTGGLHTIGRCQSHWWLCLRRVSSKNSSTHDTPSRASPPWALQVTPQALHVSLLSTPWPSSRNLETSALILVSSWI